MAKKAYIGVSGASKNVTNIYVGVNGVPKKVIKGYVGVGGVPKVFWDNTAPIPSWDFWTSYSGTISALGVTKTNGLIAYYASVKINGGMKALLISPNADAVAYDAYTSQGSLIWKNFQMWYYNMQGDTVGTSCLLSDNEYSNVTDAVNDLIERIYSVNFHLNYQSGETYGVYLVGIPYVLKKIFGVYLHRYCTSIVIPNPAYMYLSNNIGEVFDAIEDKFNDAEHYPIFSEYDVKYFRLKQPNDHSPITIQIGCMYMEETDYSALYPITSIQTSARQNLRYNDYYNFTDVRYSSSCGHMISYINLTVSSSGIQYSNLVQNWEEPRIIGVRDSGDIYSTNVGMDYTPH